MNPHINTFHSNRVSGGFFIFLAACSAYLASFALVAGNWWLAAWLIFGIIYCGFLGWIALSRVVPQARPQSGGNGGNGGRGLEGAGKPEIGRAHV